LRFGQSGWFESVVVSHFVTRAIVPLDAAYSKRLEKRSNQSLTNWPTVCDINSHKATIDCVSTLCRTKLDGTAFVEPSTIDVKPSYAGVSDNTSLGKWHTPSLKDTSLAGTPLLEGGLPEDVAGFCTLGAGAEPDEAKVRSRSSSSISNLLFLTS
jgi:hypothetical protein